MSSYQWRSCVLVAPQATQRNGCPRQKLWNLQEIKTIYGVYFSLATYFKIFWAQKMQFLLPKTSIFPTSWTLPPRVVATLASPPPRAKPIFLICLMTLSEGEIYIYIEIADIKTPAGDTKKTQVSELGVTNRSVSLICPSHLERCAEFLSLG